MQRRTHAIFAAVSALALCASTAARADFIDLWADKTDVPTDKAPPRGTSKILVIPVQIDYSGVSGTYGAIDIQALDTFFTGAASQGTFNFQGYLKVASNARYTPEVTVAPLVHYVGCPPTLMDPSNPSACTIATGTIVSLTSDMDFVRDVFNITHATNHVDFSQFDVNGQFASADGTIDGVIMVVNVPGIAVTLPLFNINGGSNLSGGTGGPLILDGIKIPYVSIGGSSTFTDGSVHLGPIATEEFGHELGLTTLGYRRPTMNDPYPNWQGLHFSTMGDWDYGSANFIPDPESRRALAWQDQHVVSGTETLTLQPAASGGYAVKLGMMSSSRQEYFLAEVRGAVGGFDTQVTDASGNPTYGLAVYHVDWSLGPKAASGQFVNQLVSCLDCTPWHPFISNVESGGQFGLVFDGPADINAFKNTGVGDDKVLFETGAVTLQSIAGAGALSASNRYLGTNWYDGSDSGIRISNVMVNADHTVTATFTAPTETNPCSDVTCPPLMVCETTTNLAGSCVAMTQPVADGGPVNPNDAGTSTNTGGGNDSGCATSGSQTTTAMLWLLPLAILLAAVTRRRAA